VVGMDTGCRARCCRDVTRWQSPAAFYLFQSALSISSAQAQRGGTRQCASATRPGEGLYHPYDAPAGGPVSASLSFADVLQYERGGGRQTAFYAPGQTELLAGRGHLLPGGYVWLDRLYLLCRTC